MISTRENIRESLNTAARALANRQGRAPTKAYRTSPAALSARHSLRLNVAKTPAALNVLSPLEARNRLCTELGGAIALGTFYRWIREGRVFTTRMGRKILIPMAVVEDLIVQCKDGTKFR